MIPVVPHEAVPEVSIGKVYRNQKKKVPIEIVCDMFEHFALCPNLFAELFEGSLNSKLPTIWRVEKQMKNREMK